MRLFIVAQCFWSATAAAQSNKIKDYRQIVAALSQATGVSPSTPEIQSYYVLIEKNLPVQGTEEEYSMAMSKSLVGLSKRYCDEFVKKTVNTQASQRIYLKEVNFSNAPSTVTMQVVEHIAKDLYTMFLDRSPVVAEQNALTQLIVKLLSMDPAGNTHDVAKTVSETCAVVGSSISFLVD